VKPFRKLFTLLWISLLFLPWISIRSTYFQIDTFLVDRLNEHLLNVENTNVDVTRILPLLDIDLNPSYSLLLFEEGYAILSNQSAIVSEYALHTAEIPYQNFIKPSRTYVYGGPTNYAFTDDGIRYRSAIDGTSIRFSPTEKQKQLNKTILSETTKKAAVEINYVPLRWRGIHESLFLRYNHGIWINNAENYPEGNGICGPIAVAILMSYYQDHIDRNYVPNTIRTPESRSPGNLIYLLTLHIGGVQYGTIGWMLYYGIQEFLTSQKIDFYQPKMTLLETWDAVVTQVDQGRPIAVGLTSWAGSPASYGNHWVTVYAYAKDERERGYYKAIDNHGNYKAVINTRWTVGTIWLEENRQ